MGRNEKRIYKIRDFVPVISEFVYTSLEDCGKSRGKDCAEIAENNDEAVLLQV